MVVPMMAHIKGNILDVDYYMWDNDGGTDWTTSELNTTNLNTNYWNYLGASWQNLIAETTWYLGGSRVNNNNNNNTVKGIYEMERNNSNTANYNAKIGLMYLSDFGYASNPNGWTVAYAASSHPYATDNWMFMGLDEWTLTVSLSIYYNPFVIKVSNDGYVDGDDTNIGASARPVFYLNSNVEYNGGTGLSSDPYTLAV